MRNSLIPTIAVSTLLVLLLSQRYFGFMIIFVLLVLIPSFAYSGIRCTTFPAERKLRVQKAIVWCIAVAIIFSVHRSMSEYAQTYAQSVVEKIEAYISSHGRCPAALEDVGISTDTYKKSLGGGYYVCDKGEPSLFYPSTGVPFEKEHYDFAKREWRHID